MARPQTITPSRPGEASASGSRDNAKRSADEAGLDPNIGTAEKKPKTDPAAAALKGRITITLSDMFGPNTPLTGGFTGGQVIGEVTVVFDTEPTLQVRGQIQADLAATKTAGRLEGNLEGRLHADEGVIVPGAPRKPSVPLAYPPRGDPATPLGAGKSSAPLVPSDNGAIVPSAPRKPSVPLAYPPLGDPATPLGAGGPSAPLVPSGEGSSPLDQDVEQAAAEARRQREEILKLLYKDVQKEGIDWIWPEQLPPYQAGISDRIMQFEKESTAAVQTTAFIDQKFVLTERNLRNLVDPTGWLHDTLVDAIIHIICEHGRKLGRRIACLNSFWLRRRIDPLYKTNSLIHIWQAINKSEAGFWDLDYLVIPFVHASYVPSSYAMRLLIILHRHWSGALVLPRAQCIIHLDSLWGGGADPVDIVEKALEELTIQREFKKQYVIGEWQSKRPSRPRQRDGQSCGPILLVNILAIICGKPLARSFTTDNVTILRRETLLWMVLAGQFYGFKPPPQPVKEPNPGPAEEPNPEPAEEPNPEPAEEPNPEPAESAKGKGKIKGKGKDKGKGKARA